MQGLKRMYPFSLCDILKSQQDKKVVGMVGDGIKDAPALVNADISNTMGSSFSVTIESADIEIVKNDSAKLLYSYHLSRRLNRIIKQIIIFSISVIVILIFLSLLEYLDLPLGVFFPESSTILVILKVLHLL